MQGFFLLVPLREVLFVGGAIGIVMMAQAQMKSSLESEHPESNAVVSADFDPIQTLSIDRDHQSLVVHSWKTGFSEIRLADGETLSQSGIADCEAIETSETNSKSIYLTRWVEDGQMVLSVSVVQNDATLFTEEFEIQPHADVDARISCDGSMAMVVFHGGRVVAWDLSTAEVTRWQYQLPTSAPSNRLSPDGKRLMVISHLGEAMICDSRTGKVDIELPRIEESCRRTAWSCDGRHVAVGNQRGEIVMFDAANGQKLWEQQQDSMVSQFIKFSTDGSLLAVSGYDCKIRVWNVAQPDEPPLVLSSSSGSLRDFVFTDSDKKIISGGSDGVICEWSLASCEVTRQIRR